MSDTIDYTPIEEIKSQYYYRALDMMIPIWNSGITFNSIVIGVCALLVAINSTLNKTLIGVVASLSIISIILLTWNFILLKKADFIISDECSKYIQYLKKPQSPQYTIEISKIESKMYRTKIHERIAIFVFVIQIILILVILDIL